MPLTSDLVIAVPNGVRDAANPLALTVETVIIFTGEDVWPGNEAHWQPVVAIGTPASTFTFAAVWISAGVSQEHGVEAFRFISVAADEVPVLPASRTQTMPATRNIPCFEDICRSPSAVVSLRLCVGIRSAGWTACRGQPPDKKIQQRARQHSGKRTCQCRQGVCTIAYTEGDDLQEDCDGHACEADDACGSYGDPEVAAQFRLVHPELYERGKFHEERERVQNHVGDDELPERCERKDRIANCTREYCIERHIMSVDTRDTRRHQAVERHRKRNARVRHQQRVEQCNGADDPSDGNQCSNNSAGVTTHGYSCDVWPATVPPVAEFRCAECRNERNEIRGDDKG